MATTYRQPGHVLTFTAPAGGVTTGVPLFIGGLLVIPTTTALVGVAFEGMICGVHAYTKTASQAWAEGQDIFWDVANAKFTSDPLAGPLVGFAAKAVGSGAGETTGEVKLLGVPPAGREFTIRRRVAIADVNAGATLVPAIAGRRLRLLDAVAIAIGGAVGAVTTVDILGTVTTARKLVAFAQANLTQSTVLRAGGTGATVLADGASFTQNDANTAITVGKTGADATTATHIDVLLTYAIDPA